MTSYLNAKGFQCSTLSDILAAKLKNLNSISPKSGDDRRSSNNSVFNFNSTVSPSNGGQNVTGDKSTSGKKLYHVNIHKNSNFNIKDIHINTNTNSPNLTVGNSNINTPNPSNNSNTSLNNNAKIMRIIRGGGGKNYDYNSNPQNFFFSKMLNKGSDRVVHASKDKNKSEGKKLHLDKLRKERYEQGMKYLDNDELNNSKESDIIDIQSEVKRAAFTPQKEKGGFFNFFTKIIK